jgi:hypothetical protein
MKKNSHGNFSRIAGSIIALVVSLFQSVPTSAQFSWGGMVSEHSAGVAFAPGVYNSYGSAFIGLQKKEQISVYPENELSLYTDLLLKSFKPTHLLTELTLYPTSALSGWLKTEHFSFYRKFDLINDLNLWSSLAGNYQEPWSVSLFVGQLANFVTLTDDEELRVGATGAGGLVITTGWQEIFDGYVLNSNWWRCEWKIKGTGKDRNTFHTWDIKIGYRWYGLPEITNTLNLTFSRQKTEKGIRSWNFHRNSCTEIEFQIPPVKMNTGCSRLTFAYGKFLPFRKYLIGLKIGYSYEYRPEYRGPDKGFTTDSRIIKGLIFQPMVEF